MTGIVFEPEKASAILAHGLDDVPLPPHHPLKPQVLLSPLGFRQGLAHVAILILTIVPLRLKLNLYLLKDICLSTSSPSRSASSSSSSSPLAGLATLLQEAVVAGTKLAPLPRPADTPTDGLNRTRFEEGAPSMESS